jgi:hypothetical protein
MRDGGFGRGLIEAVTPESRDEWLQGMKAVLGIVSLQVKD